MRRRLTFALIALALATPAWAAPQWNAATTSGTGGQTSAYTTVAVCDSTHFVAISRRATSLTNAVTLYTITGGGAVTATDYTPSSAYFTKVLAVGCTGSRIYVGGGETWILSAPISDPTTWTTHSGGTSTGNAAVGILYGSPAGGGKIRHTFLYASATKVEVYDLTPPSTFGALASAAPAADDFEVVSVPVSSTLLTIASTAYSSGQSYYRAYASGASYAHSTQETSASAPTGTYLYQPVAANGTLGVFTVRKGSDSKIYVRTVSSSGITQINTGSTTDLRPLGDWDPSGSLRRVWWVGSADGKTYASDSVSAPTAIAANATYDMSAEALQGSTPVVGFTKQYDGVTDSYIGVDMNQDGTSGDAVVLLANEEIAYYGEPPVTSSAPRPKRSRSGPFNFWPFRAP